MRGRKDVLPRRKGEEKMSEPSVDGRSNTAHYGHGRGRDRIPTMSSPAMMVCDDGAQSM
jgi:hypothetical protein